MTTNYLNNQTNMKYKKKDYKTWNKTQKAKFIKIAEQHQEADRFIQ